MVLGVEAATPSMRPGPLSPERGPTAAEAAAALHKVWLSSVMDVSWQISTPPTAEATLALATVPPPSQDDAVLEHAEAIQQTLRRAASKAVHPFECEYLLRPILVYEPKDLNRDWSPCFSLRCGIKNGWIRAKTAGNLTNIDRSRYTSTCGKVWCSRGTAGAQAGVTISIWRPSVPDGHVYFGDFAHPGEKRPPNSAVGMLIGKRKRTLPLFCDDAI
jgi:hypothetical protein